MIDRYTPREKLALAIAAVAILLTILVAGIILPYRAAVARLDQRIVSRQGQIVEAKTLVQRIRAMQGEAAAAERKLGAPAAPLVSTLEGLVAGVAGKEKLLGIRPQQVSAPAGFRVERVEMQLEKIRLQELVQLLYAIDSAQRALQADSVKMRPRFEDSALLDVTLVVSSFVRSS